MTLRSVPAAVAAILLVAPLALAAPPPVTAVPPSVLALPGAWLAGYATPLVVAFVGGQLTFVNADLMIHNVVAFNAYGDGTDTWCGNFPAGQCPLFWSRIIGGGGESTEVLGLDNLAPGRLYTFYCQPHPGMKGTLVALPGAVA